MGPVHFVLTVHHFTTSPWHPTAAMLSCTSRQAPFVLVAHPSARAKLGVKYASGRFRPHTLILRPAALVETGSTSEMQHAIGLKIVTCKVVWAHLRRPRNTIINSGKLKGETTHAKG